MEVDGAPCLAGIDIGIFTAEESHPDITELRRLAALVCARCPFRLACREMGMDPAGLCGRRGEYGVWGGWYNPKWATGGGPESWVDVLAALPPRTRRTCGTREGFRLHERSQEAPCDRCQEIVAA